MIKGRVCKGIAGFYYVHTPEGEFECKAKGIFRRRGEKPLVGDWVELEIEDVRERKGQLVRILPRKNALIRPEVANVDQALVIFALHSPEPNLQLLDRFLISMEQKSIPTVILLNKLDLAGERGQAEALRRCYEGAGYSLHLISTRDGSRCRETVLSLLAGKTSVMAGPSGVGKSSLMNLLCPEAAMETGGLSRKIERGRHTTRHSELFCLPGESYLFDTPGFTSLSLPDIEPEALRFYYHEFDALFEHCRFNSCMHLKERDCAVRTAVAGGKIPAQRYENYVYLYEELCRDRQRGRGRGGY